MYNYLEAPDFKDSYDDEIDARVLKGTFDEIKAEVALGLYGVEGWIAISYQIYN